MASYFCFGLRCQGLTESGNGVCGGETFRRSQARRRLKDKTVKKRLHPPVCNNIPVGVGQARLLGGVL